MDEQGTAVFDQYAAVWHAARARTGPDILGLEVLLAGAFAERLPGIEPHAAGTVLLFASALMQWAGSVEPAATGPDAAGTWQAVFGLLGSRLYDGAA